MKSQKNNKSDQVEKELQGLIDQLNSENAALSKILSMVETKKVTKPKETSEEKEPKNSKVVKRNKQSNTNKNEKS
jgi:hypothetical protein